MINLPFYWQWIQRADFPRKLGLCECLFGENLQEKGVAQVMTGAGISWKLDLRNPTHRWIVYGYYDPPFLRWAKRYLPKDGVVVDSGANIGQTVLYLGQYVPSGKLFAFEPGSKSAEWLAENVQKNKRALPGVEIVRFALGDKAQTLHLVDTWKSERFHGSSNEISSSGGEPVPVVKLDDFIAEKKISKIDLWKLDVEGYELPALGGAERLLREHRVRALYVELYRKTEPRYFKDGLRIREYLSQFGYRCHIFSRNWGRLKRELSPSFAADGLFLLEERS